MFAYLEGVPGGSELEKLVKKYKTAVKAHWSMAETQWTIPFLDLLIESTAVLLSFMYQKFLW